MTLRKTKKKESFSRKILENERSETAALVDKQSNEMLELISARRSEYMQSESIFLDEDCHEISEYPLIAPKPCPPAINKFQIYEDPIEFFEVDQIAISVAQNDQKTFTDLVRQLVGHCTSDIEKARTIFRWITVKNLNTMQFDDGDDRDTPLGLLRGIKYGTESVGFITFELNFEIFYLTCFLVYSIMCSSSVFVHMLVYTALSLKDIQRVQDINLVLDF